MQYSVVGHRCGDERDRSAAEWFFGLPGGVGIRNRAAACLKYQRLRWPGEVEHGDRANGHERTCDLLRIGRHERGCGWGWLLRDSRGCGSIDLPSYGYPRWLHGREYYAGCEFNCRLPDQPGRHM